STMLCVDAGYSPQDPSPDSKSIQLARCFYRGEYLSSVALSIEALYDETPFQKYNDDRDILRDINLSYMALEMSTLLDCWQKISLEFRGICSMKKFSSMSQAFLWKLVEQHDKHGGIFLSDAFCCFEEQAR